MTLIQLFQRGRGRLLAGIALSALYTFAPLGTSPTLGQTAPLPGQEQPEIPTLIEQIAPSVVTVTATATFAGSPGSDIGPEDDVLREFFHRFGDGDRPMPDLPFAVPEVEAGPVRTVGTGFVVGPEGLIVTADALIADASRVEVTLPDGRSQTAEIVGRDAQTGLALLRGDAEQVPALSWGPSTELGLGESLVLVGRTEDFGSVLSTGMLAGRSPDGERLLIDGAAASALVGAPVLDSEGRVVAIRTASEDTDQIGATVALAADAAREVVDELARSGSVARGYLGVQIQPVTADIAAAIGMDQPEGVLIAGVQPHTPAAEAGLQDGDVVLSLDGEAVSGPEALSRAVADREPGEQVHLEIWRSDGSIEVTATLAAQPGESATPQSTEAPVSGVSVPELGLTFQPLTPDLRDTLGTAETTQGVAVLEVEDPSRTDVQQGDVVVSINRTAAETVEDVQEAVEIAAAEGRSYVLLLIERAGERTFVAVPLTQS